jgi:tetratricopeptide (TPR) repeat protein
VTRAAFLILLLVGVAFAQAPDVQNQPDARARRLLYSGQIARAVAVWEDALKTDPRNWDVLASVGAVLYADGKFARAATFLDRAAQLRADDASLRLLLGTALHLAGDEPQARAELQRIIASNPNRGTVQIARDKLDGRYIEGEATSEAAIAARLGTKPEPGALWIGRFVDIDWAKPRPDLHGDGSLVAVIEAAAPLGGAVLTGGDHLSVYGPVFLQTLSFARNRYLVVVRAWRNTPEEKDQASLVQWVRRFEFFLLHVRSGSPRDALQKKLETFRQDVEGKLGDAVESARAVLRLAPDDPQAHYQLGHSLTALGQLEAAAKEQHTVLARWPDFARAHFELGVIEAMQKHYENAAGEFLAALGQDPTLYEAYRNLALTYLRIGQMDRACESVARARETWPSGPIPAALQSCDKPSR